jgi:ATP-binding cassette subfamily B protein
VDSGAIRIDGQDVREIKKDDLRLKLGLVLQDNFCSPIRDREHPLRAADATDTRYAAAQLANADAFIRHLPHATRQS